MIGKRLFAAVLAVFAVAIYSQETFSLGFDGPPSKNGINADWEQNKAPNFKPFGKTEIIPAQFENFKQALRITSSKAATDVLMKKTIPAKVGDAFQLTVVFRSPDGKSRVKVGFYGFQNGSFAEYQGHVYHPIGTGWDRRSVIFEVKKLNTNGIRFYLHADSDTKLEFSNISYRKLRPDELNAFSPGKNRALWKERTQGVNLARGSKITFEPSPELSLTKKGGTDALDLIDGEFGSPDDQLWYDRRAVAWFKATGGVTILADLGSVKPVKKGVIRINGGKLNWITFPSRLEIWASKDGKNFYRGQALRKTAVNESAMSNWKDLYYLPETPDNSGTMYVYPFELSVCADARYIAFRAPDYTAIAMVSDELAIIQATPEDRKAPGYNALYKKDPEPVMHKNVIIRPRMDQFYVSKGIYTPNILQMDARKTDESGKAGYIIDLPASVTYKGCKSWPSYTRKAVRTEQKGSRVRYHFLADTSLKNLKNITSRYGLGPFYFSVDPKAVVPEKEMYAEFTSLYNGKVEFVKRMPLKFLEMPKVPAMKKIKIDLWIDNRYAAGWPEYIKVQKHIGINSISFSPWMAESQKGFAYLIEDAHKNGLSVRLQMSPTMMWRYTFKNTTEYRCTSGNTVCCLAYRGPYFQKFLDVMAEKVRDFPAEYITFDEESWEPNRLNASMKCTRCDALRKSKGMTWEEYFNWAQAEYLKYYKGAVAKGAAAAGRKPPRIGFYNLSPIAFFSFRGGKTEFLGYSRLFPRYSDEVQPSYYARDTAGLHTTIRKVWKVVKNPEITIPWITGGAGAHREGAYSNRTGQHLLESLMNGAGGVQYFYFEGFESPLDYFYHARSMKQLAPYENIIMHGSLDEKFKGSNPNLVYTSRTYGKQTLILVGNYAAISPAETVIPVNGTVTDLVSGRRQVCSGKLTLKVPADDYILLLAEQK